METKESRSFPHFKTVPWPRKKYTLTTAAYSCKKTIKRYFASHCNIANDITLISMPQTGIDTIDGMSLVETVDYSSSSRISGIPFWTVWPTWCGTCLIHPSLGARITYCNKNTMQQVSTVIWQKATSPTCHHSQMQMDSSDLGPMQVSK